MALQFTPHQRRVLGVLIEKSMTTPAGYPMTLNSIVTGCNQLTCREPVMRLTESEVSKAIYELQQMMLVKQADPDRTARANRFQHQVEQRFGWDKRERALIAELLLRGPQTPGELKTNGSRMTPFEDLQNVLNLLGELARHDPPFVRELPRQPGQGAIRYDHLFYADDERQEPPATAPPTPQPNRAYTDMSQAIMERLERIEADMATLRQQVETLLNGPG
jgi:uncharacterized protein